MSNYIKFQEMTVWQKVRLFAVSFVIIGSLVVIAGILTGCVVSWFMWGFNLVA
jgi:hypothetical protein